MALNPDFTIAGVRLFSDIKDIDSQLPTESLRTRFITIADSVSTLTNYKESSRLDQLLRLRTDLNNVEKSTLASILKNTSDSVGYCRASTPTNLFDASYPRDMLAPNVHTELVNAIKNRLKEDMQRLNLGPLGTGEIESIHSFRSLMIGICSTIFGFYYPKFRLLDTSLPEIFNYDRYVLIFTDYLQQNVRKDMDTLYSSTCSDDTYFKEVQSRLLKYARSSEAQIDIVQKDTRVIRIFLSCFFPYFQFDFYLNNIATKMMNSMDRAPRFFLLRQIAILAVYLSIFYVTLQLSGSGAIPDDLRFLMSKINDVMLTQEISLYNNYMTYANVHQEATDNRELSKNLAGITKDITVSRGNLSKAVHNDQTVNAELRRAYIIMWIWTSLLIATVAILALLYFLHVDWMFAFIAVMMVILGISGIVTVSKKF